MRPLRLVALDLGLAHAGITSTHDQVGTPRLSSMTVSPRKRPSTTLMDHQRAHEIIAAIMGVVRCKPDLVIVERPFQRAGQGDTSVRLGEIHGAIKHWMWSQKLRYVDVHQAHVKQYSTGNGGAKKDAVLAGARSLWGSLLHIGSDHEADATSLLMQAADHYGSEVMAPTGLWVPVPPVPEKQRRALAGTGWPELAVAS
jgi:crossover junction endodeoxyribonuclease RuvC